jgi:uncharacterized protein with HEPN domain
MSKRPIALLIDDMSDAVARIEQYRAGLSKDRFVADRKTADAVVRNLEILGEAANRLSD